MNSSTRFFTDALEGAPVVALFRGLSPDRTVALCHVAWDAGIPLVEVPVMSALELPALAAAIDAGRHRGQVVGAGTITTPERVREVHEMGAAFTVAPGLHPRAVERSLALDLPHLPGVATSSEIAAALDYGYEWLKVFPAAQLTPGWFAAQAGPFPTARFVASGGVTPESAANYFDAGCAAVAFGGAIGEPAGIRAVEALIRSRQPTGMPRA